MRYVQRAESGKIVGTFANAQPGFAEECLEDADGDLLAFLFPVPTLAQARSAVISGIDADTDALIASVIGNRATEYERAEAEATVFAANGYLGMVPSSVQSWADAKVASGWTVQQAADDILATAAAWRPAQEAIRAQRLLRKEQARLATDAAGVAAALTQWAGFLAGIKAQLGV